LKMVSKKEYNSTIEIQEGTKISLKDNLLIVSGPKGESSRAFAHPKVIISINNKEINLKTVGNVSKREKKILNTFTAHIKNMVGGVSKTYNYKLKVCSGHFPMSLSMDKENILIKNFLGEKIPRKVKLINNVNVNIDGDIISISSVDKELAGRMSSSIEQATRITNKDRRRFMDGIWIIEKGIQNE